MNAKQRRDWEATSDMFRQARGRQARSVEESPSGATATGLRPYKCPCCNGYGKRQIIRSMMTNIIYAPCYSCGGQGVVWG